MLLETICSKGHVEHVEPSVSKPAEGIYIWGSGADFCDRWLNIPGERCEAPIVASWYLRDNQRIQVAGSAPGEKLRVDKAEEARATGAPEPIIRMIDEVVGMLKDHGVNLSAEEKETVGSMAARAGVYSHVVDLVAEDEPEPEDEPEDLEPEEDHLHDPETCPTCRELVTPKPAFTAAARTWLERQASGIRIGIVAVAASISLVATVAAWLTGHKLLALLF